MSAQKAPLFSAADFAKSIAASTDATDVASEIARGAVRLRVGADLVAADVSRWVYEFGDVLAGMRKNATWLQVSESGTLKSDAPRIVDPDTRRSVTLVPMSSDALSATSAVLDILLAASASSSAAAARPGHNASVIDVAFGGTQRRASAELGTSACRRLEHFARRLPAQTHPLAACVRAYEQVLTAPARGFANSIQNTMALRYTQLLANLRDALAASPAAT